MSDFTVGAAIGLCVGLLVYKLFALMVEACRDYDQEMLSLPDSPVGRAYRTGYDHGQIEGDRVGYLLGIKKADPGTGKGDVVNFPSIQDSTARYSEDTQSDVQPELEHCPVCRETLPSGYKNCKHETMTAADELVDPQGRIASVTSSSWSLCRWCGRTTADHAASTLRRHRKQVQAADEAATDAQLAEEAGR